MCKGEIQCHIDVFTILHFSIVLTIYIYIFQKEMLHRMWTLLQCREASPEMFGSELITVLLNELVLSSSIRLQWSREEVQGATQLIIDNFTVPPEKDISIGDTLGDTAYVIAGRTSVNTLTTNLMKGKCHYPMIYDKAMGLCERQNIAQDLTSGLRTMRLQFFPDISYWDASRHANMKWDGKKVLQIQAAGLSYEYMGAEV